MSFNPAAAPYEGSLPYVFISYAHEDRALVYPLIDTLHSRGFRVWYDAGVEPASEWPENIADHVAVASCMIAFASRNYFQSINCKQEMHYAQQLNKSLLVVYLEDISQSPGMHMQLDMFHAMYRSRYSSDAEMMDRLTSAAFLRPCLAHPDTDVENFDRLFEQGKQYFQTKRAHIGISYMRLAAAAGHAAAIDYLASCYYHGTCVLQNYEEAARLYKQSADMGFANAQHNYGLCLYNGKGLPKNKTEAFVWIRKAAAQRYQPAIQLLKDTQK